MTFVSAQYVEEDITIGSVTLPQYSIQVEVAYQDGDEDLGVKAEDLMTDLNRDKYIEDQNGDLILIGSREGLPAFNCVDYEVIRSVAFRNVMQGDTVLIDPGFITGNATFEFLYENQNGDFVPFDQRDHFDGIGCNPDFSIYFVDVNDPVPPGVPYSITQDGSKRGRITFDLIFAGFQYWLDIADFKIRIQMYDRAGNASNVITTDAISK